MSTKKKTEEASSKGGEPKQENASQSEEVKRPPTPAAGYRKGKWGKRPAFHCATQGCDYVALDEAQIRNHVQSHGR